MVSKSPTHVEQSTHKPTFKQLFRISNLSVWKIKMKRFRKNIHRLKKKRNLVEKRNVEGTDLDYKHTNFQKDSSSWRICSIIYHHSDTIFTIVLFQCTINVGTNAGLLRNLRKFWARNIVSKNNSLFLMSQSLRGPHHNQIYWRRIVKEPLPLRSTFEMAHEYVLHDTPVKCFFVTFLWPDLDLHLAQ